MQSSQENFQNPHLKNKEQVSQLVEHLFRRQAGQLVATLTRVFGIQNLDLAEDVVQDTLYRALQQWVYRGIPDNPSGWILRSARNRAVDVLRRQARFREKQADIIQQLKSQRKDGPASEVFLENELRDDQLRMMFTCSHPALPRDARTALTLKTLCGFSVSEIARTFLTRKTTIAQRIVRAKRKIRDDNIPFEVPDTNAARYRLDSVLEVLYLLFNEGYSAHEGENLIRQDLCEEAIRLTHILIEHPVGKQPKTHALLALMLFQASRLPARVDSEGRLLLLKQQNRALWNQRLINAGMHFLDRSSHGTELTEYHLQAGIAACHATAPDYAHTDWDRILAFYDHLININNSPIIILNRAVALSMVKGAESGVRELEKLHNLHSMKSYHLFHATLADFYEQSRQADRAKKSYEEGLRLVSNRAEREFLSWKLRSLTTDKKGRLDLRKERQQSD